MTSNFSVDVLHLRTLCFAINLVITIIGNVFQNYLSTRLVNKFEEGFLLFLIAYQLSFGESESGWVIT